MTRNRAGGMAIQTGARLGGYEIRALLGVGGMGEVYQARDMKLGRDVAVKVLRSDVANDAQRLARFEREARLLASLNHPHIAALLGMEENDGRPFLVMELAPGPTLAERLADGPLSLDETLALGGQIAEALQAAHDQGIIHRDLKPGNIKITPGGKVKLLDFGLAKALVGDTDGIVETASFQTTRAGAILGTPCYMSPEQVRGQAADRRADIWAFGCVLFEALTARQAFTGKTGAACCRPRRRPACGVCRCVACARMQRAARAISGMFASSCLTSPSPRRSRCEIQSRSRHRR
jgi:serine/threonine protein kinase